MMYQHSRCHIVPKIHLEGVNDKKKQQLREIGMAYVCVGVFKSPSVMVVWQLDGRSQCLVPQSVAFLVAVQTDICQKMVPCSSWVGGAIVKIWLTSELSSTGMKYFKISTLLTSKLTRHLKCKNYVTNPPSCCQYCRANCTLN